MINSCKIRASALARSSLSPSRRDGTKRDWGTLFFGLSAIFHRSEASIRSIDPKHRSEASIRSIDPKHRSEASI
ncbi:MAG: hypothetical protein SH818_14225, partial [Saprospiraceae bacterium]|nr:hypothetical protein [Saprospiraceae bacterium]